MPSATEANSNPQSMNIELLEHMVYNQYEDGGMEFDANSDGYSDLDLTEEFSDDCSSPVNVDFSASDDEFWPGDDTSGDEGDWESISDSDSVPNDMPNFFDDLTFCLSLDKKQTRALLTKEAVEVWLSGGDAPCTFADCPIKIPHNNGRYVHEDAVPVHHDFFGTCAPPAEVYEAFRRIERLQIVEEDEDALNGFVRAHVRLFGRGECGTVCETCQDICEACKMGAEIL